MNLPQILHVIWFGGMPPNSTQFPVRFRLCEWRRLNPEWTIILWTDRQNREEEMLKNWCEENQILCQSIHSDIVWGTEKTLVFEQLSSGHWATASDIVRMRVVYQCGGLYVDCDVVPMPIPIVRLWLGMGLLLKVREGTLYSVSPHAIASAPGHYFWQMVLWRVEQNFHILRNSELEDFRLSEDPVQKYGGTLALSGDILRPALRLVWGLFGEEQYGVSKWLSLLQLKIAFQHLEEHMWLDGETLSGKFHPKELMIMIDEHILQQSQRPLTSILHWAAAYGPADLIEAIAQEIGPFESYFGFSPKGMAKYYHREPEVMAVIPDM